MSDDVTVKAVRFSRVAPWIRVGQALGIALSPQQVLLGMLGVLILWGARRMGVISPVVDVLTTDIRTSFESFAELGSDPARATLGPWSTVFVPIERIVFGLGAGSGVYVISALVGYVVWTVLGVAMTRCAALQFFREEPASIRSSLQWSLRRWVTSITALVTPVAGAVVLGLLIAAITIPASIPGVGSAWVSVTAPVQVMLGLALGGMAITIPLLWPLAVTAVAVDDSDSFDAFSRAFSFLSTRIWTTAGLVLLNLVVASLGMLLVDVIIGWSLSLMMSSVVLAASEAVRASILASAIWWFGLFRGGVASSLFWTHVTIVYGLLRQSTDGTPLSSLAGFEDDLRSQDPFPVVGIPAVEVPANGSDAAASGGHEASVAKSV